MSHGPGRVQRAILDLIATDEALASFDGGEDSWDPSGPGPVGVPLAAVFVAVYGTDKPTRAQQSSMERAVRVLRSRGLMDTYGRWTCPKHHKVIDSNSRRYICCGRARLAPAIGRPRTDEERAAHDRRFAQNMAALGLKPPGR